MKGKDEKEWEEPFWYVNWHSDKGVADKFTTNEWTWGGVGDCNEALRKSEWEDADECHF